MTLCKRCETFYDGNVCPRCNPALHNLISEVNASETEEADTPIEIDDSPGEPEYRFEHPSSLSYESWPAYLLERRREKRLRRGQD